MTADALGQVNVAMSVALTVMPRMRTSILHPAKA